MREQTLSLVPETKLLITIAIYQPPLFDSWDGSLGFIKYLLLSFRVEILSLQPGFAALAITKPAVAWVGSGLVRATRRYRSIEHV